MVCRPDWTPQQPRSSADRALMDRVLDAVAAAMASRRLAGDGIARTGRGLRSSIVEKLRMIPNHVAIFIIACLNCGSSIRIEEATNAATT